MGPEAENILQSFGSAADTFSAVVKKLNEYFIPKRNFIAERQTFEQRNQAEWESNEQYIRILFAQADKCDFADKQERLRDRLLAGMKDKELSKKIQLKALEESVTLDTVIQMLRNTDIIETTGERMSKRVVSKEYTRAVIKLRQKQIIISKKRRVEQNTIHIKRKQVQARPADTADTRDTTAPESAPHVERRAQSAGSETILRRYASQNSLGALLKPVRLRSRMRQCHSWGKRKLPAGQTGELT